jgi:ATP-dependent Lon protease
MVGEYAGEGDLIQLITDEEDDQNGKEILKEEIRYFFQGW